MLFSGTRETLLIKPLVQWNLVETSEWGKNVGPLTDITTIYQTICSTISVYLRYLLFSWNYPNSYLFIECILYKALSRNLKMCVTDIVIDSICYKKKKYRIIDQVIINDQS